MSVINEKQLDQLCELIGGDQESLFELIETFLEEGREMILEMETSTETNDLDTLRRCAHSMKSSSQDFGAVDLSELNAALEAQCKSDWPETANQQVQLISLKFHEASVVLADYISRQE